MIKQLSIRNFQSHQDTKLLLSSGVNTFIGQNDSGKSSIIRAIRWLTFNRPRGSGFIRHGSKECQVSFSIDGHKISRFRKGSKNEYSIDGESLEAISVSVPQQVQDTLDIQPINIQSQHDPMFMVLDPPGKIASVINDTVHLDKAEAAANKLSANIRENQRDLKRLAEQKESLGQALGRFVKLDQYKTLLDDEIALGAILARDTDVLEDIRQLRIDILAVDKRLKAMKIPQGIDELLLNIDSKLIQIEVIKLRLRNLSKIAQNIEVVDRKLGELGDISVQEKILAKMRQVSLASTAIEQEINKLANLAKDITDVTDDIFEMKIGQKSLTTEYNKLIGELDVCPTCGQMLDDEHRKTVLENVK